MDIYQTCSLGTTYEVLGPTTFSKLEVKGQGHRPKFCGYAGVHDFSTWIGWILEVKVTGPYIRSREGHPITRWAFLTIHAFFDFDVQFMTLTFNTTSDMIVQRFVMIRLTTNAFFDF